MAGTAAAQTRTSPAACRPSAPLNALARAGVGAGGAASAAIEKLLGAPKERLAKIALRQRVQLYDLAKGHLPERAGELAIRRHPRGAKGSPPFSTPRSLEE